MLLFRLWHTLAYHTTSPPRATTIATFRPLRQTQRPILAARLSHLSVPTTTLSMSLKTDRLPFPPSTYLQHTGSLRHGPSRLLLKLHRCPARHLCLRRNLSSWPAWMIAALASQIIVVAPSSHMILSSSYPFCQRLYFFSNEPHNKSLALCFIFLLVPRRIVHRSKHPAEAS